VRWKIQWFETLLETPLIVAKPVFRISVGHP
jgi:hypothetical protein